MLTSRQQEILADEVWSDRTSLMSVRRNAWEFLNWKYNNFDNINGFVGPTRELICITEESLQDWPGDAFCPVI